MKNNLKKYGIALALVGFATFGYAQHGQRDGRSSGSTDRGGINQQHQVNRIPAHENGVSADRNRQTDVNRQVNVNRQTDLNRQPDANRNADLGRRNDVPATADRGGFGQQRPSRNVTVYNNNRVNNNYRYPGNYNSRPYPVHYNYAPRRYVYVGAPRYSILPRTSISINFGGYPYYYNEGSFFHYYDGFYEPVYAPIGIHIRILPPGYRRIYLGQRPYYYYDGIYYSDYSNNEYEVVDAPMGAEVYSLPKGATAAVVNGEKFYEFNGTYYKEGTNSKNEVVYTVVGKYGEINNSDDQQPVSSQPSLRNGDVISRLPENSRQVTINGEVLYVSPDNTYFKAQANGDATGYRVVGTQVN